MKTSTFSKFYKYSEAKEPPIFLNRNLVVGIEKVVLYQHFELRMGYLSHIVTGKLFWKIFHEAIAEATKALVPYFEVSLNVFLIKRPRDTNLVFYLCVLDARIKTCEKTEGALLKKCI